MRKNRVIEQNRSYHLVSRLAHRAFFLDDEEKDRAVALMRRVEEFSGLAGGPMSPSELREGVGIKSRIHFSRYYMTPLMEKGLVERTDPENPMSPRQEYKLA